MPGYEIIERASITPYNADGIVPHENRIGFIDFLREVRNEADDIPRLSSYMVVGIDDVLYLTRPEDRHSMARKIHDVLQSGASALLSSFNVSSCRKRQLYQYIRFYQTYPQIVRSLSAQLQHLVPQGIIAVQEKVQSTTALTRIDPQMLLQRLSYMHIEHLISIDDDTKRVFYEIECINGTWSVRELKRQIGSLYYERSGLSTGKGDRSIFLFILFLLKINLSPFSFQQFSLYLGN